MKVNDLHKKDDDMPDETAKWLEQIIQRSKAESEALRKLLKGLEELKQKNNPNQKNNY